MFRTMGVMVVGIDGCMNCGWQISARLLHAWILICAGSEGHVPGQAILASGHAASGPRMAMAH